VFIVLIVSTVWTGQTWHKQESRCLWLRKCSTRLVNKSPTVETCTDWEGRINFMNSLQCISACGLQLATNLVNNIQDLTPISQKLSKMASKASPACFNRWLPVCKDTSRTPIVIVRKMSASKSCWTDILAKGLTAFRKRCSGRWMLSKRSMSRLKI